MRYADIEGNLGGSMPAGDSLYVWREWVISAQNNDVPYDGETLRVQDGCACETNAIEDADVDQPGRESSIFANDRRFRAAITLYTAALRRIA